MLSVRAILEATLLYLGDRLSFRISGLHLEE